nr:hypothetical protein CFP56_23550 [Quercus suber]
MAGVFVFTLRQSPLIGAENTDDTLKAFEGFLFEDLMCNIDKVWPRSCRMLRPMEVMEGGLGGEVVGSDSEYGSVY